MINTLPNKETHVTVITNSQMSSNRKSYSFIGKPDANFFCAICLDLACQPKQCENCGKLFCTKCINKNGRKPCPNCRIDDPKYFRDTKSKQLLTY